MVPPSTIHTTKIRANGWWSVLYYKLIMLWIRTILPEISAWCYQAQSLLFLITRPTAVTDTSLQSSHSHDRWKLKSDFNYSSKAQLVVQFISILFKNTIMMKKKFSVFFPWCQKILAIAIIFSNHSIDALHS